MDRDCNNCIYHTSGMCRKWHCEMTTLEDYRNKVIDEFAEKICQNGSIADFMKEYITEIAEQMKGRR